MNQEKTPTNSEKEPEQKAASEKEPQISDEMNGKTGEINQGETEAS